MDSGKPISHFKTVKDKFAVQLCNLIFFSNTMLDEKGIYIH